MSRIKLPVKGGATYHGAPVHELIVGLDRPLGHWFYQVWGDDSQDDDPNPLNENALIGCSRWELLDTIEELADIEHPLTKRVAFRIALDLNPGGSGDRSHG